MRSGLALQRKGFFPVVQLDEIQDRLLELLDGVVDAAPEPAAGQLTEESLDGVRPITRASAPDLRKGICPPDVQGGMPP